MSDHDDFIRYPVGSIKKGDFCRVCKRFNARNSTCSVIAHEDGKILMIKRGTMPLIGYWALPGGYLDWEETLEQCALRELKEETGYVGKVAKLFAVNSSPKRSKDGKQNIDHVYLIENISKRYGYDDNEILEVRWFSIDDLPKKIAFDHKGAIEKFRKSKII